MKTIELNLREERPVESDEDVPLTVKIVEYLLNLLLRNAPAEINGTLDVSRGEGKSVWEIQSFAEGKRVEFEEFRSYLHRAILANFATMFIDGNPYLGAERIKIQYLNRKYYLVVWYGNDSLAGYWLKARCSEINE